MVSRSSHLLVAAAVLATVLAAAPPLLGAAAAPVPASAAGDPEADLEAALAAAARVEARLDEATTARDALEGTLEDRTSRHERATADLRAARAATRTLAVAAYVDGGSSGDEAILLAGGPDLTEDAYRSTLLTSTAAARRQTATYFGELRRQADDAVTGTLEQLDRLDARVARLATRRDEADDAVRAARTAVAEAEAAAETTAAAPPPAPTPVAASTSVSSGEWQPIGTLPGGPTPEQWGRLRNCESSGNYRAVSPSGAYRGAYQFDLSTWQTVGGSGDPAAAPAAEQDHRAQRLYASRGASPWPVCGRYLY